jgi:FKBP-type peptidyl-prolyl cis-trans isomerase SlyD
MGTPFLSPVTIFFTLRAKISKKASMKVEKNKVVSIHYTLKSDKGELLDTSDGKDPLPYIHGKGQLIPGLEKELEGKEAGAELSLVIPPAEAYGDYNEEQVFVVGKEGFQGEEELTVGLQVQMDTGEGQAIGVVTKIEDENVTLDLNHPLAGTTLHFEVKIVELRDATKEELDHGHSHGEGGHQH